jgi:integrase
MSRRGHGEGTIRKRADGRWHARVSMGQGKRKDIYAKTRKEVQDQLRDALKAHERGQLQAGRAALVGPFLLDWIKGREDASKGRYSTLHRYREIVELHLIPDLGRIRLDRLSSTDVQRLLNAKRKTGSAGNVRHIRAVLRIALNVALRNDLVVRNVAALVDLPDQAGSERTVAKPGFLTGAQARQLLGAARSDRLSALYSVAIALGLRQGEALGLRWEDVDLETGVVNIRKSLQLLGKVYVLGDLKTQKSRRTIFIPASVLEGLRAHRQEQRKEQLRTKGWTDRGFVFCARNGQALDPGNVRRRFYALLTKAGLPRVRFHDLRHSCASLLAAQGVPARVAMEILGHSNISTTLNIYTHVAPEISREAAALIDQALTAR